MTSPPAVRNSRPPGPGIAALAAVFTTSKGDPYTLLPEIARRHGDVVNIPVPMLGWTLTLLAHPDHIEHVMTRHHQRYRRHYLVREMVVGEPGVIPPMEGDEWRRWRGALNPFFGPASLATVSVSMAPAVAAGVDAWGRRSGQWLDLEHELGTVVMDALMRSMFSTTLVPETLHRYVQAARDLGRYTIGRAVMSTLPAFLPRPLRGRGETAQRMIFGELDRIVAERKAQGPKQVPDLLDTFMAMAFDGSAAMRYRRLRTELSSMVFAGFETTAESVAWTLALLQTNPAALARAYDEVDALGGGLVRYEDLDRLPYLRACLDEGLRLQAPPGMLRTAVEDDDVGGYLIPKDSHVLVCPYGLHQDPRFWTEPQRFDPDRFMTGTVNRNAFIPFNTGPRKCLGYRLAYIDGIMTLATILARYTLQTRPGWTPKPKMRISTGLAGGLPVRLTPR